MNSNIVKITNSLENQLRKKTYNLSSSLIKEFQNRSGFVPFKNEKNDISGIALIDSTMDPPIRILSYEDNQFDQPYLKKSISEALSYREKMSKLGKLDISQKAAYRLVNETGDGLPGLSVDVYADFLHITTHSEHWSPHINFISDYLMEQTGKRGVYWKTKFKSSTPPQSKHYKGDKLVKKNGVYDLIVEENGMKVYIDLNDVASTGLFMDQRANRQYVSDLFKGRESGSILNTFSHTGTFSLLPVLQHGKITSYNIDVSKRYLEMSKRNYELNGIDLDFHRFVEKDVFGRLYQMKDKSLAFDVIVLDPPTVARGPTFGVFTTKNRYRELLDLALPNLKDGGFILCFVNTRQIREEQWLRQLGISDYMAGDNGDGTSQTIPIIKTKEELMEEKEIQKLNIETAQFSPVSKISKHTANILPFEKLKHFKSIQSLEQDVDFRWREGDERVGKHLKGVVLKHKFDYYQTRFNTSHIFKNKIKLKK